MEGNGRRGILVVFEGIDGAGKTTQAAVLAAHLRTAGLDVLATKEPTRGVHGQRLRDSASTGRLPAEEELRLFVLDRREHVAQEIAPALAAGTVVIVDRYYFSTAAYQGARGLDWQAIIFDNEEFAPRPDLLFLLDIVPAEAMRRIADRGEDGENHFEREDELAKSAAIFDQVQGAFVRHLDGTRAIDDLHAEIVREVDEGPLFLRHCLKTYLRRCEPIDCSYRITGECAYPALKTLRPPVEYSVRELNRIATSDLPIDEKIALAGAVIGRAEK